MKKTYFFLFAFIAFVLLLPKNTNQTQTQHLLMTISTTLRGEVWASDIASDIIGFRALVEKTDPYPVLGKAHRELGITWDIPNRSTHPPTTFLLTAPIALFPWSISSAIWGWLMVVAIVISFKAYQFSWPTSIIIALLILFWPAGAYSLGQLTPIWLLGISLAYQERNKDPFKAGIWIGLASITKFFPAILLLLFLVRKKWNAFIGFALVWLVSSVCVWLLNPSAFQRYIEANQTNSLITAFRIDNCALLPSLYLHAGLIGFGLGLLLLLCVLFLNWRIVFSNGEIQQEEWFLLSFLSVAFLPIAWIYSLLPLIPGVLALIRSPGITRLLGILLLVIPLVMWNLGIGAPSIVLIFFIVYSIVWIAKPNHRLLSNSHNPIAHIQGQQASIRPPL